MVRKERRHIVYVLLLASVLLFFIPRNYTKAMIVGANSLFSKIEAPLYRLLRVESYDRDDKFKVEFADKEALQTKLRDLDKEKRLAEMNLQQTQSENARLKEELEKFGAFQALCGEVPPERRMPANVCGVNMARGDHFIYLDRGADQGVQQYYGVVSGGYVIGEVAVVSKNYSIVRLITDPELYLQVRIRETRVQMGQQKSVMVSGREQEPGLLSLRYYPRNETDLKPKYVVETSGLDGYYDSGMPIGVVEAVYPPDANQLFFDAAVRPLADLHKLETVFVVIPKLSPAERRELLKSGAEKKITN